jgi:hypothetical protein
MEPEGASSDSQAQALAAGGDVGEAVEPFYAPAQHRHPASVAGI